MRPMRRRFSAMLAAVLLPLAVSAGGENASPAPTTPAASLAPTVPAAGTVSEAEATAAIDRRAEELLRQPPEELTREEIAFALGWLHHSGALGEADGERAEILLRQALDAGLAEAGVILADLYLNGTEAGRQRDAAKAVAAYAKAAALGSVDADRLLGTLLLDGAEGVPPDAEQGRRHLAAAARNGSEAAARRLRAEGIAATSDPALTEQARQRAARLSAVVARVFDLLAQSEPAAPSRTGGGLDAAERERLTGILKKAVDEAARDILARQPSPRERGEAAAAVGALHVMGLLHGVDMARALEYLRLAADADVPEAMVALAELFLGLTVLDAQAVELDAAAALDLLNRAAGEGSSDAWRLLGVAYAEGLGGLEANPEKASEAFLNAGRQGDPEALERLAPFFAEAARRRAEHPDEPALFPTEAAGLVHPALSAAREERFRMMARLTEAVNAELGRKAAEAVRDGLANPQRR